ncbi:unnamed protein product [Didymodactylos carnosus]|uniref:Timeless N-terminal domain-containing protein n=1 Tax=Didymodactylos carnosus TaxID=1234261 RepID=A0A814XIQ7_9BILA|nr:unnamed protein product [Didymodactylos carnosus]CAF1216391.1 unnamed protein product [Didymodactylos carnosus]CAF3500644.1 unnamed protein product [Didymodactylos carnosus]CAF3980182.1 unnamed protein product [Didymodactylos carnosus]
MSSFNQIQSACSALGYYDGKSYLKDEDCEDALRVLIRCLRFENEKKDSRIQMLESKIIENDLIPILVYLGNDNDTKTVNLTFKLLVNLTKPPLHLANEKLFQCMVNKLRPVLEKEWLDRTDDDDFILHAVFTCVRNILSIRPERTSEENDVDAHDLVLWSIHTSGMEDLLLYIGNNTQSDERIMNILEIVVFMLREQSAEELARAGEQQTKSKREKDNDALAVLYERESTQKQQMLKLTTSRSVLGGATYVISNAKGIGENQLICHRPLQSMNAIEFDREKKRVRKPKNRAPMKQEIDVNHHSALSIRLFLKEFCLVMKQVSFGQYAFLRNLIVTHIKQSIELGNETMQMNAFHLIHTKIDHYREMIKVDKKDSKLWGKRLQIAFSAFKEYILCIKAMLANSDESIRRAANIMKSSITITLNESAKLGIFCILDKIFYVQEYREQILNLLKEFDNTKMSDTYLRNLIESTHEFLKLLEEHTTNGKHLFVQKRKRERKNKKSVTKKSSTKTKTTVEMSRDEPNSEELERDWEENVAGQLSSLLQGIQELQISHTEISPFDPLSIIPVDDQSIIAVGRIQKAMRMKNIDEAVALFRASREVWRQEPAFGFDGIDSEEEFNLFREIFMSKINVPLPQSPNAKDEIQDINDEEQHDEEGIKEEETDIVEREEEFDIKRFIMCFAHSNVLCSYIDILKSYSTNSLYLNHCIIRMFYRISIDCDYAGILFQMSLFRIIQNFYVDPLAKCEQYTEFFQFSKWLLRKFFSTIEKNPLIYGELLFWKDRSVIEELLDGHKPLTDKGNVAWTEEQQDELKDLFLKIKLNSNDINHENGDIVDQIMRDFSCKNKTRKQIIKELKCLQLIQNVKELKLSSKRIRKEKKEKSEKGKKSRKKNLDLFTEVPDDENKQLSPLRTTSDIDESLSDTDRKDEWIDETDVEDETDTIDETNHLKLNGINNFTQQTQDEKNDPDELNSVIYFTASMLAQNGNEKIVEMIKIKFEEKINDSDTDHIRIVIDDQFDENNLINELLATMNFSIINNRWIWNDRLTSARKHVELLNDALQRREKKQDPRKLLKENDSDDEDETLSVIIPPTKPLSNVKQVRHFSSLLSDEEDNNENNREQTKKFRRQIASSDED